MEGSQQPVRAGEGCYEVVHSRPHREPEAEAACDGSKTFGVPCSRPGTVGRAGAAPEGPSSIDADFQSLEILARDGHALSFLIAAIRQMRDERRG